MKVIAFNGSPRKEGNTYYALSLVGEELLRERIGFEVIPKAEKSRWRTSRMADILRRHTSIVLKNTSSVWRRSRGGKGYI